MPWTEHYSALGPEVTVGPADETGVVDYTEKGECRVPTAGMHVVRSTEPLEAWIRR